MTGDWAGDLEFCDLLLNDVQRCLRALYRRLGLGDLFCSKSAGLQFPERVRFGHAGLSNFDIFLTRASFEQLQFFLANAESRLGRLQIGCGLLERLSRDRVPLEQSLGPIVIETGLLLLRLGLVELCPGRFNFRSPGTIFQSPERRCGLIDTSSRGRYLLLARARRQPGQDRSPLLPQCRRLRATLLQVVGSSSTKTSPARTGCPSATWTWTTRPPTRDPTQISSASRNPDTTIRPGMLFTYASRANSPNATNANVISR